MFDYHILVIVFSIICIWCSTKNNIWQTNDTHKKYACIALCILFIVQAGFRDIVTSGDTFNYYNSYLDTERRSWSELFSSLFNPSDDYQGRDPGYKIFVKITQAVWPNFLFFLNLVAAIVSIPLCRMLYRFTTSVAGIFMGAVLYEALCAPFFNTGIRQTLAMGFCFYAFLLYYDKKSVYKWISSLLVAISFHASAIVFVPMFIVMRLKNQNRLMKIAILVSPLIMLYANQIVAYLGEGTIYEQYAIGSTDNMGTPVFTLLVFLSVITIKIKSEQIQKIYPHSNMMFTAMVLALVLTPSSWVDSNFVRTTFYYLVFLMPMLSVIIDTYSRNIKSQKTLYYTLLSLAFIYLTA